MVTIEAEVRGVVQGVGFRLFVKRLGEDLGVQGAVWNTHSGAVELVAQGAQEPMAQFEKELWAGPGSVSNVDVRPREYLNLAPGFEIRRTV